MAGVDTQRQYDYISAMTTNETLLLTRAEVGEILRISRRTVERMEESGQLSPIRVGRQVRFRREDIESLIKGDAA